MNTDPVIDQTEETAATEVGRQARLSHRSRLGRFSRPAVRTLLTVLLSAAALTVGSGVAQADVTAAPGGLGRLSAACNTNLHSLTVNVTQDQQFGPLGQQMSLEIWVYSYRFNTWSEVKVNYDNVSNSGTATSLWTASGLPTGQYAVYARYWWKTASGWIQGGEYPHLYTQVGVGTLVSNVAVNSSTCRT